MFLKLIYKILETCFFLFLSFQVKLEKKLNYFFYLNKGAETAAS